MWWLLLTVAWLLMGVVSGALKARKWYARQLSLHLEGKADEESYYARHRDSRFCGNMECPCSGPSIPEEPTRGEAAGRGLLRGLMGPIPLLVAAAMFILDKVGRLTFAGIEEKVREDLQTKKQLEKFQFIEQFRGRLDGLAFAKAMATRPGEVAAHNHEVALLIQDMKGHRDSPLTTQELEDLAEMYRAPEGLRVKEVSK